MKFNANIMSSSAAACGLCVVIWFAITGCKERDKRHDMAVSDMRKIAGAAFSLIQLGYSLEEETLIENVVKENSSDNAFYLEGAIHGKVILDPFGRPYRVRWNDGNLTIWSVGNNGIDEIGKGDDISISQRVSESRSELRTSDKMNPRANP